MKNPVKIKYVVKELSGIINRQLSSHEWGRVGVLCRTYSVDEINECLDALEDAIEEGRLVAEQPVGLLQQMLSGKRASIEGKKVVDDLLTNEHPI